MYVRAANLPSLEIPPVTHRGHDLVNNLPARVIFITLFNKPIIRKLGRSCDEIQNNYNLVIFIC